MPVSMKTRKIMIKVYVWSTYGCEMWTITTRNIHTIALVSIVDISEDDENVMGKNEEG